MNRKSPALFRVFFGLLLFATAWTCSAQGIQYIANPPSVRVSSGNALPNKLGPFCTTSVGPLICYSPSLIRTAYSFPSNLDGSDQTIVIVDAYGSPTIQSDLATFDSAFGIAPPPSFTILRPEGCPKFNPNDKEHGVLGWSQETSLDVEYAHAMAPGANIVLVVAPSSTGDSVNLAERTAIKRYPGSVISQSFGSGEFLITGNRVQVTQAHENYVNAQNAGITVLASAGDSGAANAFMQGSKLIIGSEANDSFPASDPLVTAVGGTQGLPYPGGLANCGTTSCTGVYGGEQVWTFLIMRQ